MRYKEDSSRGHSWRIAKNCLVLGSEKKLIYNFYTYTYITKMFRRISRKILCFHPKINSSIFSSQTKLEL